MSSRSIVSRRHKPGIGSAKMQQVDAREIIENLGIPYMQELSTFGALSPEVIRDLLEHGRIERFDKGEFIEHFSEEAADFQVVLMGKVAYYKRFEDHDVLTRYFKTGEQFGFDEMIGLISRDGTDVMIEDSLILSISNAQFCHLHVDHPEQFGIFMINLSRELAREIEILENVIGCGTGWSGEAEAEAV